MAAAKQTTKPAVGQLAITREQLIRIARETGCVDERGDVFFLSDPNWTFSERAQADAIKSRSAVELKLDSPPTSKIENPKSKITQGWLCLRTGGSSGGVKFARHDEETLSAAVRGFCTHFGFERVNAVDVLPPFHVSGFMARVRCAATGGTHLPWEWRKLAAGERPKLAGGGAWAISLVPTQLQRLLPSADAVAWLKGFAVIFVGGGPMWPDLAESAARVELPISVTYGMSETAAMIAALKPAEFLAGERSCGAALPHGRISIAPAGVVHLAGESLFRGYWPEWREAREFASEDLGRIDDRQHLHILGRRDAAIISGGKKIQPADVEAALRASGEFSDVAVIGVPDPQWGEAVVACYATGGHAPDVARASVGLAKHQRPKRFIAVAASSWPRNAQGKIDRAALRAWVMEHAKVPGMKPNSHQ